MLPTYTIYLCVLFFSSVMAFGFEHSKSNFRWVLWGMLFFTLWLPAAIRYGVGTDYYRYINMVDSVRLGYISTELGYYLINLSVVLLDISPQWAIALSSFIVVLFCLKAIPKKYFAISVFVFVATFYLPAFSLIRQAIAIAFIAYAVRSYIDGNKIKYITFIVLGAFFHLSALILLPFYFLAKIKASAVFLIIGMIFLSVAIFIGGGLNTIVNSDFLAQSKYGYYAASNFVEDAKIGSGIGVLIKMMLPLLLVINSKAVLKLNPNLNLLIWISAGCIISNICSMKIQIFNRLADVFLFSNFIVLPYLLASFSKDIIRKVSLIAITSIFFIFYCRTIQVNYNDDQGGIGISPYDTIFSK
ncbi:EpsG family protein [Scandinavium goeteborgense]|uniref:EpsG family protein n=1 Tax=Scandinavium goeteborgense TaxID=1851514 RepID=UPI002166632E|nr:EpsG family protein [Scandinavium goeteborgense]MCS2154920.1 EpsG family protein [Scandinavium goeteborgense]